MPGFDGTGPMGMGPMTGGGWGRCNPYGQYGRRFAWRDSGPRFGWGRGRGYRHRYWATGLPGPMRYGPMGFWGFPWGDPFAAPYTKEQEKEILKDQTEALKQELDAIDSRLRELESEGQGSE